MQQQETRNVSIIWRGKKFSLEMDPTATLKSLGDELLNLTNVRDDTMRLIVPTNKSSRLLYPFSEEHSFLKLEAASILEGKSIRMLGVPKDEVDDILQSAKADLRIVGFDDEERRSRQRTSSGLQTSLKLPLGPYVFCDFRTLHLPGVELNPPASRALKLMHKLAADPGIVAIMNKHRWRVGIMTEMAPEGYVGVSPKCILGFNKNHGEEISLRLRTDDLKGFRKYDSIKKTLLHELAHMVHSEHDVKFYALLKQLNEEADMLDWTKSRSHTLSGDRLLQHHEEDEDSDSIGSSHKLGGQTSGFNARASSVVAAYSRLQQASTSRSETSEVHQESTADDSSDIEQHPKHLDVVPEMHQNDVKIESVQKCDSGFGSTKPYDDQRRCEPDPDDYEADPRMSYEPHKEAKSDDHKMSCLPSLEAKLSEEPDPDDCGAENRIRGSASLEPDPDEHNMEIGEKVKVGPNAYVSLGYQVNGDENGDLACTNRDYSPEEFKLVEPYTDCKDVRPDEVPNTLINEPNPNDQELQRIQDPVAIVCSRLQKAIGVLRSQANPLEVSRVVQTVVKIIRNIIEHPDEVKFRKLRKANPVIQRDVLSFSAAMEILSVIGFSEDVVINDTGRTEAYLVLKRNDPGLLWLAKSSLETSIA